MTVNEVRKIFPHEDFVFFKNGFEYQGIPFLHQKIKGFQLKGNWVCIEL